MPQNFDGLSLVFPIKMSLTLGMSAPTFQVSPPSSASRAKAACRGIYTERGALLLADAVTVRLSKRFGNAMVKSVAIPHRPHF